MVAYLVREGGEGGEEGKATALKSMFRQYPWSAMAAKDLHRDQSSERSQCRWPYVRTDVELDRWITMSHWVLLGQHAMNRAPNAAPTPTRRLSAYRISLFNKWLSKIS